MTIAPELNDLIILITGVIAIFLLTRKDKTKESNG